MTWEVIINTFLNSSKKREVHFKREEKVQETARKVVANIFYEILNQIKK